jgi:hypothetical protein
MATPTLRDKRIARENGGASRRPRRRFGADTPLDDAALKDLVPAGLAASFVKSKLHDKALATAGLGEPEGWDGDMPELPKDIAATDHHLLANLLATLASALSTALWNASKNYIEADAYGEIAEYLEDVALLGAEESNEGKRKAAARTDERVVAAKALEKTAYHNYVRFRDLARTLEHQWRTVSRVGGFVSDEVEAETAGAIKRPTRGRASGQSRGSAKGETKRRPRK